MTEAVRAHVYTLPFGADICDATIDLVLKSCGDKPLALTEAIIFLPNNRAIRAMTEGFVRRAQPGLLMPRLVAIGDLALDESLGPILDPLESEASIPPLIAPLKRQLLLAEMVKQQREMAGQRVDATEAMRLARLLAGLIDELDIEQVSLTDFQGIANEDEIVSDPDLAGHWQRSYASLLSILPQYHHKLLELGCDGPAARRNMLLSRFDQRLQSDPLTYPIFACGISTAAPAIAALLKTIAMLPTGHVVLPPVDLDMDEDAWRSLGPFEKEEGKLPELGKETHPQYHLKLLIERMSVNRVEIRKIGGKIRATDEIIPQIFCLPKATIAWNELPSAKKKMPNLRVMEAEDSAEEARAVAILVREALEKPEHRIAIVTPDRELALRISEQLKRWNIEADDSAGQPLLMTPAGRLILALLHGVADHFSPVSVLAIAKYPLVKSGDGRLDWLERVRALDLELRGPSRGSGLASITRLLTERLKETKRPERQEHYQSLLTWWEEFANLLAVFDSDHKQNFSSVLDRLAKLAGVLTGDAIWAGAAGRQLAALFEELSEGNFDGLGHVEREALPEFFTELASGRVVRPPYGGHPRVALLGLLEARLQPADLVICAGLNEGSWPQLPQPDPWLAPSIRRRLGLPALERNIGLAAHDLATTMGAKECVITRAKRDRSGPAVTSRFLLRIEAFLGDRLQQEKTAIKLARQIDVLAREKFAEPPAIKPSADQRLVDLSVTDFDGLLADPYSFYAKKILRVPPLNDVDEEPGAAWRGTMIHDLLEKWAIVDKCEPERLAVRAKAMLDDANLHPNLRALWQPRITQALQWVAEETAELFANGRRLAGAEVKGSATLAGVSINGRADRIDYDADGNLVIIDYKSGKAPEAKQIRAGFALQLGLLGGMAEQGAFKDIKGDAKGFEYWSFAKDSSDKEGNRFGKITTADGGKGDEAISVDELVSFMQARAIAAIEGWITGDVAFKAKLHSEYAPYAEYDQLSRLQEWDGKQAPAEDEIL